MILLTFALRKMANKGRVLSTFFVSTQELCLDGRLVFAMNTGVIIETKWLLLSILQIIASLVNAFPFIYLLFKLALKCVLLFSDGIKLL